MAVIKAGAPVADAGGGGAVASDPIDANKLTLAVAEWSDVSLLDVSSTTLGGLAQSGDGLLLTGPGGSNVYSAARLSGALPAGDGVYAARFGVFASVDGNVAPGVEGFFGVSPGGLGLASAQWCGAAILGQSTLASAGIQASQDDNSGTLWPGWTGASIGNAPNRYGLTIAIERVGTDVTVYYVNESMVCQQIDTYTMPTTAGDVFFRMRTTNGSATRCLRVAAVAVEGLAIVGGLLVSA